MQGIVINCVLLFCRFTNDSIFCYFTLMVNILCIFIFLGPRVFYHKFQEFWMLRSISPSVSKFMPILISIPTSDFPVVDNFARDLKRKTWLTGFPLNHHLHPHATWMVLHKCIRRYETIKCIEKTARECASNSVPAKVIDFIAFGRSPTCRTAGNLVYFKSILPKKIFSVCVKWNPKVG